MSALFALKQHLEKRRLQRNGWHGIGKNIGDEQAREERKDVELNCLTAFSIVVLVGMLAEQLYSWVMK
jgi:hypothetical protein